MVITLLSWGYKLLKKLPINNLSVKTFFVIIYIISGTTFVNIIFNESYLLVDNGNLGWTFEVGDARELARNLDKLLEDQNSARLKAVGAKEKIVRYYREEIMLTAWENLLIQAKEEISN